MEEIRLLEMVCLEPAGFPTVARGYLTAGALQIGRGLPSVPHFC